MITHILPSQLQNISLLYEMVHMEAFGVIVVWRILEKITLDVNFFLWKKERVCLLISSPGASSTSSYSPGPSTPPSYSSGPSTPQSYSSRPARNAECSNCNHLVGKITAETKGVVVFFAAQMAATVWQQAHFTKNLRFSTVAAAHCVTFGYKYGTPHGVKYLRGLDTNQRAIFARLHQGKRNLNFYGVPQSPQVRRFRPKIKTLQEIVDLRTSEESSEKDRKLHLSMYGKAAQLEKQMGAKLAWLQEKYSYRTCEGIGYSSSQANCYLTEKELHQLRMDERTLEKTFAKRGHEQMATRERK
ncbi:hypothetical protein Tco_0084368 [Tanacetum coccineum]